MQLLTMWWCLVVIFCAAFSMSDAFSRIKRNDIDLQTCINNFDIHRDKIIRTQDSQNMGAKYLNEFDLGTREECLRLCCETEDCDVFVFEEKNSGSCYLFHCGPPEDFKCKFTHHVNYSSAVLAINRHLPDLESQIKLTKHEQDLNKLRKTESEPEIAQVVAHPIVTSAPTAAATSTTIKSKEVLPGVMETTNKKSQQETRKCSRYQFECRSTSECIAIYNACDGIPQCADGSDEAPELGCPDSIAPATTLPPHQVLPQYEHNMAAVPPPPARLHPLQPVLSQPEMYRPPIPQQQQQPQPPPEQLQPNPVIPQEPNQDFIRPRNNLNNRLQYDGGQYVLPPVLQSNSWMPHANNQIAPQVPQYTDKNSHIFTHKENGLQVADRGQEIRYNKHKGAMQYLHRALGHSSAGQLQYSDGQVYNPKVNNYYNYRPVPVENWNNPVEDPQFNAYPPEALNKDWHQENSVQIDLNRKPDAGFQTTSVMDHPFGSNKENPKHEQDKMAHELKHSKESVTDQKIKIEKHKVVGHEAEQHYPDVVAYKVDDRADGIAETPSGAVLSLTLGLIITCIMALLIGCRLRVKRRMRKGGKSYAHDADYLVNGMYL